MTAHDATMLMCDAEDGYCEETYPTSWNDQEFARQEAARFGWTRPKRDMDYCPDHSKKETDRA